MNKEQILKKVNDILESKGHEETGPESTLKEDVGLDSLDMVEFIMEIERDFNLTIPDDDADGILTVGQAVDYIESKLAEKAKQTM